MVRRFIVLRELADNAEAEILHSRLATAGIESFVEPDVGTQSFGAGESARRRGARLKVSAEDYESAESLLKHDQYTLVSAGRWQCGRCREENEPAFEVCWSCLKERDEQSILLENGFDDESSNTHVANVNNTTGIDRLTVTARSNNPYRPVLLGSQAVPQPPLRPTAQRHVKSEKQAIIRWTVISMVLFPPIPNIVAIAMVIQLAIAMPPGTVSSRFVITMLGLNLAIIILIAVLFIPMFVKL